MTIGADSMTSLFSFPNLVGQFILGTTDTRVPEEWSSERIGGWILGRHQSLPSIRLLNEDDRPAGWLLGYPIDGKGKFLGDGDALNVPGLADGTSPSVEQFIYGFGGRFLVALVGVPQPRLYLDPAGSLSVVYCPHQKVVASTSNLIPYDEQTCDRVDLAREMGIPNTNAMYPLELTHRQNVERLLPNHYLDLTDWQRVRHWPKEPLQCHGSVEEAVAAIAAITKRNIAAVVSRTPTYLRLTAGNDSRMLLACARDVVDRLELFTVPRTDDGGVIDTSIARKIAKRFHLRHFVLQPQKPKQEDLDEYMFRISYGVGEVRGWLATTMYKQTDPAYANLLGCVGEVGRAYLSRKDQICPETNRITPERLLEYCQAPRSDLTLSTFRRWLETVPAADTIQILDFLYLEQRVGCWGGILPYAHVGNPGFIIYPMVHREIIERMLTLPTPYRRSGALMRDVISREWPELLEWPFNKPVGFLHVLLAARRARRLLSFQAERARLGLAYQADRVGKALRNPGWAVERIWKRLS